MAEKAIKVDAILTNGGTGIANRDVTIEAVKELMTKEIPGFGELFRMFSFQEDIGIGSHSIKGDCWSRN